jgi:acetate kinase
MNVLALNSGSSSVKFGFYDVGMDVSGRTTQATQVLSQSHPGATPAEILSRITLLIAQSKVSPPDAIGHRIVHGGKTLRQHCVIDDLVMQQLENTADLSPLHALSSLQLIKEAQTHFPGIVQVACLDTTFHTSLPAVAYQLPIAHDLQSEGVRRYGFHGLSCESIVRQLYAESLEKFPRRLIIAHLGNGVSVTAVKDGQSIDTSMGLTPTGGVIMGTRSGDLDPGLLFYLMRAHKLDVTAMEQSLNHESGLLGISGFSSDMRRLQEAAALHVHPSNETARLAVDMFCYCLRKQIAGMIAVLEGVDMLVFTGGIGENDAPIRDRIFAGLCWAKGPTSALAIKVMAALEEEQIARLVFSLAGVIGALAHSHCPRALRS